MRKAVARVLGPRFKVQALKETRDSDVVVTIDGVRHVVENGAAKALALAIMNAATYHEQEKRRAA